MDTKEIFQETDGIDTTTTGGKPVFHIMGALADNAERGVMHSAPFSA